MKLAKARRQQPPLECCEICRYYQELEDVDPEDEDDPDAMTGICRRYPPVLFPGIPVTSAYPEVSGEKGWCGEFTPRS